MNKETRTRYREQEDSEIFNSFPSVGPQLAPRLLVAFGSNRARYESCCKYAGICWSSISH